MRVCRLREAGRCRTVLASRGVCPHRRSASYRGRHPDGGRPLSLTTAKLKLGYPPKFRDRVSRRVLTCTELCACIDPSLMADLACVRVRGLRDACQPSVPLCISGLDTRAWAMAQDAVGVGLTFSWISHTHTTIAGIVNAMHRYSILASPTRTGRVQLKGYLIRGVPLSAHNCAGTHHQHDPFSQAESYGRLMGLRRLLVVSAGRLWLSGLSKRNRDAWCHKRPRTDTNGRRVADNWGIGKPIQAHCSVHVNANTRRRVTHNAPAGICMRDAKSKSLIKASCRIGFHDAKRHILTGGGGLLDQTIHDLSSNALPLEGWVDEELRKKERSVLHTALQPTNVDTIEGDDPNLRGLPPLAKVGDLGGHAQVQLSNGLFHPREIEGRAVVNPPAERCEA